MRGNDNFSLLHESSPLIIFTCVRNTDAAVCPEETYPQVAKHVCRHGLLSNFVIPCEPYPRKAWIITDKQFSLFDAHALLAGAHCATLQKQGVSMEISVLPPHPLYVKTVFSFSFVPHRNYEFSRGFPAYRHSRNTVCHNRRTSYAAGVHRPELSCKSRFLQRVSHSPRP